MKKPFLVGHYPRYISIVGLPAVGKAEGPIPALTALSQSAMMGGHWSRPGKKGRPEAIGNQNGLDMGKLEGQTGSEGSTPSSGKRAGLDPIFLLIIILAAGLFFYNLGQRPLWQDEAETGCLAKNVLKYGKPLAFDGVNLVSQEEQREFGDDYLWRWSPWLQIYAAAAGFYLGGVNTVAGRLPFALAGFACLFMVYFLIKRLFDNPALARISTALLAFSVPFILFSRQLRYYGVAALLVMISLDAFRRNWQKKPLPAAILVVSLALLFYANYLLYLSYCVALAAAALIVYRHEIPVVRTIVLGAFNILLVLPGVALSKMGSQSSIISLSTFPKALGTYLQYIFQFFIPLPLVFGLCLIWLWIVTGRRAMPEDPEKRFVLFLTVIVFVNVLVLSMVPQIFIRYLAHLFPLCAIILGWIVLDIRDMNRLAGALTLVLLLFTNWLYIVPMDLAGITVRHRNSDVWMLNHNNFPLKLMVQELTSDFPDVNKTAIDYLKANARPGDTVLTTYGDLPLQFYTDCQVFGGLQDRLPPEGVKPDWVIRRPFISLNRFDEFYASEVYLRDQLDLTRDYEAVTLSGPSELFGNRPDPAWHRFVPLMEPYKKLIIYRKKQPEGAG